jgi:hypothetical protein
MFCWNSLNTPQGYGLALPLLSWFRCLLAWIPSNTQRFWPLNLCIKAVGLTTYPKRPGVNNGRAYVCVGVGVRVVVVVLVFGAELCIGSRKKDPPIKPSISGGCDGKRYWRRVLEAFCERCTRTPLFPYTPNPCFTLFFGANAPLPIYTTWYFAFSHFLFNALWASCVLLR